MRAIYLTPAPARLQLLAFSRGNHGVGPFLCRLANLMDLFALVLLAEIAFAAHYLDLSKQLLC